MGRSVSHGNPQTCCDLLQHDIHEARNDAAKVITETLISYLRIVQALETVHQTGAYTTSAMTVHAALEAILQDAGILEKVTP